MSMIPANVLGSMVAAVMAFSFGITNSVAHGGPVVALLGAMNYPLLALVCMASGAGVTAITCVTLKKIRAQKLAAAPLNSPLFTVWPGRTLKPSFR